jgi:type IV pilus assembly protein PilM
MKCESYTKGVMALPFLGSGAKRRDQIVGIDLGAHSAKAAHLQKKASGYSLLSYAVVECVTDKGEGGEMPVAEKLGAVLDELGSKPKTVVLAIPAAESTLRMAEMPLVPVSDMRSMLKFNSKSYLQQDLTDCSFDCHILPPRMTGGGDVPKPGQKTKVLVGAVKTRMVDDNLALAREAGLQMDALVPELICPVNAFEVSEPEVFAKEAVALVDLGFRHSAICVLLEGELMLSRVVGVGGDRLTNGLAEALGTSYSEAEGIKVGLAHEVESTLSPMLSPLSRELRASIDFFEHQHDRTVSKVYVSGAASTSGFFLEAMQTELMVPCEPWNPVAALSPALPPQQMANLEASAPKLGTAVGAALSAL